MRTRTVFPPLPLRLSLPRLTRLAFAAVLVCWVAVVAHGCHGADADHEPAVAPPTSEHRTP